MTECFPFIDCAFKFSGWRKSICCRPPFVDSQTFQPVLEILRSIMQDASFNAGIEFVCRIQDVTVVGALVWVDQLSGCEQYSRDLANRRLPAIVGIGYQENEFHFPSMNALSEIFKQFVSERFLMEENNNDCFVSSSIRMSLTKNSEQVKRIKLINKRIKPSGYRCLNDSHIRRVLEDADVFTYINSLPKRMILPAGDFYYSVRGIFAKKSLMIHYSSDETTQSFKCQFKKSEEKPCPTTIMDSEGAFTYDSENVTSTIDSSSLNIPEKLED